MLNTSCGSADEDAIERPDRDEGNIVRIVGNANVFALPFHEVEIAVAVIEMVESDAMLADLDRAWPGEQEQIQNFFIRSAFHFLMLSHEFDWTLMSHAFAGVRRDVIDFVQIVGKHFLNRFQGGKVAVLFQSFGQIFGATRRRVTAVGRERFSELIFDGAEGSFDGFGFWIVRQREGYVDAETGEKALQLIFVEIAFMKHDSRSQLAMKYRGRIISAVVDIDVMWQAKLAFATHAKRIQNRVLIGLQ